MRATAVKDQKTDRKKHKRRRHQVLSDCREWREQKWICKAL